MDLALKLNCSSAADLAKLISLLQGSAYSHRIPIPYETVLIPHDLLQKIYILLREDLHVVQRGFVLFNECLNLLLTILNDFFRVILVIYCVLELDLNGSHNGFDFLLQGLHLSP